MTERVGYLNDTLVRREKLGKKELERIKGAEAGPPKEEPRESAPVNVLPVDQVASLGPGPAEAVTAP